MPDLLSSLLSTSENFGFMKFRIPMALLFILMTLQGFAQKNESLQPGSSKVDGSFIEAYSNKWKVSILDSLGNKKFVRIWTDRLDLFHLNEGVYLYRTQNLYDSEKKWQESWFNIVEAENLKPVLFTQLKADGSQHFIKFSSDELIIKNNDSQESEIITLDKPVFDWNLYGILLVGLPFKENFSFRLPFWSQQTKTAETLTATPAGQEEIETLSGNKYNTQKITTDRGLTFWLVKEKPYVIQLTLALENGSTMIWEMV